MMLSNCIFRIKATRVQTLVQWMSWHILSLQFSHLPSLFSYHLQRLLPYRVIFWLYFFLYGKYPKWLLNFILVPWKLKSCLIIYWLLKRVRCARMLQTDNISDDTTFCHVHLMVVLYLKLSDKLLCVCVYICV